MQLTVVICTRNPHPLRFEQVLAGLRSQDLPPAEWTLLIVDNCSREPVPAPAWPSPFSARVVGEPKPGLFHARLRAIEECRAPLMVFIDDDTVPDAACLRVFRDAFRDDPSLVAAGPRIVPRFAHPPPAWLDEFSWALALREMGPRRLQWRLADGLPLPGFTPIGAGLALRTAALASYVDHARTHAEEILARSWIGQGCGGNEDKDLVLTLIRAGGAVAYLPDAVLHHLIPDERLQPAYFEKLLPGLGYLWMRTLHAHGLEDRPPISAAGAVLRILRSWLQQRAWRRPAPRLRWLYACGCFRGLAANHRDSFRYPPPRAGDVAPARV
jgi:hypothetical protein